MQSRIPCTVITGFLGSGKTTLIQSMLSDPGGRRIALIVNEFGTLGVDGELIKSCGIEDCNEDDVIELANGCICCTVADDFLPTLTRLLERETLPDHIVIETSGLALPQPLLRAFAWPEIKTRVTVDGVVAVIDAAAVASGHFAHDEDAVARQRAADDSLDHETPLSELFKDQLTCADLVVLSKSDLVDAEDLGRAEAVVAGMKRKAAAIIHSGTVRPPTDVLLGVSAAAELDAHNRPTLHEQHHHVHGDHDDDHDDHDDHHHDHDHDDFDSFVVEIDDIASPDVLEGRVARLARDPRILRVKGATRVAGKPMRLVLQAVGPRIDTHFDRPWRPDENAPGHLVVITLAGVDRAAITKILQGTHS